MRICYTISSNLFKRSDIMSEKNYLIDNKDLMKEWDYEKNKDFDLNKITVGSHKKAFWKCSKCNYKWQAAIKSRAIGKKSGCPNCKKKILSQKNSLAIKGKNDFLSLYPQLSNMWNYEKNFNLSPYMFKSGSSKEVWWKCDKGHEWRKPIRNMTKNPHCPYCSNKLIIEGFNDFSTVNSKLIKEWDFELNKNYNPKKMGYNSKVKIWWKCNKGHKWQATIYDRIKKNTECPYCKGKKILKGFNDLTTTNKDIAREWNFKKNKNLLPENFSSGSDKKVWWKCNKGHEWCSTINSRVQGAGCPYCSQRFATPGVNDIATLYPQLIKEWDFELNGEYTPNNTAVSSERKIHWKCSVCGYKWIQIPHNRTKRNSGCPVCANKTIIEGFNDLATLRPELLNEWNYEKNTNINPKNVSVGTNIKVWWKCNKGHEWQASISNRAKKNNTGCPICDSERKTSIPEKTLVFYLSQYFTNLKESYKPSFLKRGEIDIFIPELLLGIEYDGERFHRNVDRDIKKNELCQKNNITILRIREPGCPMMPKECWIYQRDGIYENTLTKMALNVISLINKKYNLNINIDVDYERDRIKILNLVQSIEKNNNLANRFPALLEEWNYDKNKDLKPSYFSFGSNKIVWWKCKNCKYEWKTKINNRTILGTNCPKCARKNATNNRKNLKNERLLKNNEIIKEYNYDKNKDIDLNKLTIGSKKNIWWKCNKGHEWKAQIYTRVKGFGKCQKCKS